MKHNFVFKNMCESECPTANGRREPHTDKLKGHIKYFCTTYTYCPYHEGRAAWSFDCLCGEWRVIEEYIEKK